jgi:hypothetical protein
LEKREQMIAEFQNLETEPSVFILLLKAGGIGITLTKANHVFHFDRSLESGSRRSSKRSRLSYRSEKECIRPQVRCYGNLGRTHRRNDCRQEKVSGGDESWLTELDNEAFKQLIALNQNAILE